MSPEVTEILHNVLHMLPVALIAAGLVVLFFLIKKGLSFLPIKKQWIINLIAFLCIAAIIVSFFVVKTQRERDVDENNINELTEINQIIETMEKDVDGILKKLPDTKEAYVIVDQAQESLKYIPPKTIEGIKGSDIAHMAIPYINLGRAIDKCYQQGVKPYTIEEEKELVNLSQELSARITKIKHIEWN